MHGPPRCAVRVRPPGAWNGNCFAAMTYKVRRRSSTATRLQCDQRHTANLTVSPRRWARIDHEFTSPLPEALYGPGGRVTSVAGPASSHRGQPAHIGAVSPSEAARGRYGAPHISEYLARAHARLIASRDGRAQGSPQLAHLLGQFASIPRGLRVIATHGVVVPARSDSPGSDVPAAARLVQQGPSPSDGRFASPAPGGRVPATGSLRDPWW